MYLMQTEIVFNAMHGNDTYSLINYNIGKESDHYLLSLFSNLLGGHAPLITLLPIPAYFVFGTGFRAINVTYMLLILIFALIFYCFVSRLAHDAWTGFLAVAITITMPLTVGLSRVFLVEYGLMILVVLWMYFQVRMDNFRDRRFSIPLGIVLGLGMLMKITFPIYIFGPAIWGLITVVSAGNINKKKIVNLLLNCLIILLTGLLVMSPWYIRNINAVISFGLNSGFGSASKNYSMGNIFAVTTLLKYWLSFINTVITFYYFVVLLCFLMIQVIRYFIQGKQDRTQDASGIRGANMQMMIIWFFVPFIIFSFGINKDLRFLLPALPALGVIIAETITRYIKESLPRLVTTIPLVLAFPFYLFCFTSLPLSSTYTLSAGPFLVIAPNVGYANRPISQAWPMEQILTAIKKDAKRNDIKMNAYFPLPVGIIPNHEYFNPNTFGYYSIRQNLKFYFTNFSPEEAETPDSVKEKLLAMQYIITKTQDLGPTFAYNPDITPMLLKGEFPFMEINRFNLPDGSEAIIFRKIQ